MKRSYFAWLGIVLCLGSAGLSGCHSSQERGEQESIEKIDEQTLALSDDAMKNIRIIKAELRDFPDQLNLMGKISVAEDRMTVIPARVAGRIESVSLASGEPVEKGQLLAALFSPDYVSAREEFLQSLKQAQEPGLSGESSDFRNLSKMARKKLETMGLSQNDIEEMVKNPGAREQNLLIRAPRSGFIIDKKAVVGNLVNVGDTLFTIADLRKVWFSGDLYPEDLTKVHKNQEVLILPEGSAQPIYGKVSFISPAVDPTSRTIKIRALMDNSNSILRADMYVQGNLTLSNKRALLIPGQALIRLQDAYAVFKRVAVNRFRKVAVQLGGEQAGLASVTAGLQPGDEIVSDGALLLSAALNSASK